MIYLLHENPACNGQETRILDVEFKRAIYRTDTASLSINYQGRPEKFGVEGQNFTLGPGNSIL